MTRSEEILRSALIEAQETIQAQKEILEKLTKAPSYTGYVVGCNDTRAIVSVPNIGLVEVENSIVDDSGNIELIEQGTPVRVITEPIIAILEVLHSDMNIGEIVHCVKEGITSCEVDFQGNRRVINFGSKIKTPEVGDRLLVDGNCCIAINNFGPDETKFTFEGDTGISWDQIGGLHEAKETLREAIELPFKYPEIFARYNKKNVKGVLLYGPPGCGKTLLAKAAATSLSTTHRKGQSNTGFIYVKGPELLDKFVGNTEAQIRGLFSRARKHYKKNHYPAIIFIDEAEAILSGRGSRPNMGIETTVVPQFLAEMDGLDETGAIVLLATNRPNSLDSAVTRDGRIDRKVHVKRPLQNEAADIFQLYLTSKPIAESREALSVKASTHLYSSRYKIYDLFSKDEQHSIVLGNMVNGAMIAGIVERAATTALRREIKNSSSGTKGQEGITIEDICEAIDSTYIQSFPLNHKEIVEDFIEDNNLQVTQIVKSKPAHTL